MAVPTTGSAEVHPVPHKSRVPARSVQAAHRRKGGPVARGRGGSALIGRSRPWPQCGQRLGLVPSTRERKASTVSASRGAGVGASRAARQAAQVLGAVAIGEEAIVPDPHEALGEHMEEKPTNELLDREVHDLGLVPVGIVPPTEANLAVLAIQGALVANGDPRV